MEINNTKRWGTISRIIGVLAVMFIGQQHVSAQFPGLPFVQKEMYWDDNANYSFIVNKGLSHTQVNNTMEWVVGTTALLGRTAMRLNLGKAENPTQGNSALAKYLEVGNVNNYTYGNNIIEAKLWLGQNANDVTVGYLGTANDTPLGIGVGGITDIYIDQTLEAHSIHIPTLTYFEDLAFFQGYTVFETDAEFNGDVEFHDPATFYDLTEFDDLATFNKTATFKKPTRFKDSITLSGSSGNKLKFVAEGSNPNFMEFHGDINSAPARMGYIGFGSVHNNDLYVGTDKGDNIQFLTRDVATMQGVKRMQIDTTGMVYIGSNAYTVSPVNQDNYKLWVEKGVVSEDFVLAPNTAWADFVFEEGYPLLPLEAVDSFIKDKGHLPEMPSAETVYKEGYSTAEMNRKFMMKIEELTLYTIQQEKEIEKLKATLEKYEDVQNRLELLEAKLRD